MTTHFSKNLKELLQEFIQIDPRWDRNITGLVQDSRQVKPGDLFFACKGLHQHGKKFIATALKQGAAAILIEEDEEKIELNEQNIPIITVKNLTEKMGYIAARFYDYPSRHIRVIGITGTNGKTSCTQFIAQALQLQGQLCGIIGTLGNGFYQQLHHDNFTTPDAITVHRLLAEFREQGAQYVAMEVSSHALVQNRVTGVEFYIAVFTNLTRDHLDYHGDIVNYASAKHSLFTTPRLQYGVLNADDGYGLQWMQQLGSQLQLFSYSLKPHYPQFPDVTKIYSNHIQLDNGITAAIHSPWGDGVLHNSKLLGRFTVSNLLAVITVLGILGMPFDAILARMADLRGVPGRMETFGGDQQPLVIVDFAHTPDALEQVLVALNEYKRGLLWCVFGCGGDRDRGKRPLMAKVVEGLADRIIVTDDNPRHEDPREIVAEIIKGFEQPNCVVIEHDRRRAIAHALSCAQANDIVLIAGKGHESVQIKGDQKEPFNDALEVQKLLSETWTI